jgi:NAD(P)-dependent dehydrogenase (short-subunit alcohol dehydrogenase family)
LTIQGNTVQVTGANYGIGQALLNIGVIGAGGLGEVLARQLAKLGHEVSIANSRGGPRV